MRRFLIYGLMIATSFTLRTLFESKRGSLSLFLDASWFVESEVVGVQRTAPDKHNDCFAGPDSQLSPVPFPIPSFIIGGVQKSGTTALSKMLQKLPGMLRCDKAEGHFFDRAIKRFPLNTTERVCEARFRYRNLWNATRLPSLPEYETSSFFTFEKTPALLSKPFVIPNIRKVAPWAKIVISLRNPVERAYSAYRMEYEIGEIPVDRSFEDVIHMNVYKLKNRGFSKAPNIRVYLHDPQKFTAADFALEVHDDAPMLLWEIIHRGFYALQLKLWLEHYTLGKDLMVYQHEKFSANKSSVLNEVLDFVGAPKHSLGTVVLEEKYDPNSDVPKRKAPPFHPDTRRYLELLYEPYNEYLAEMLGEQWRGVWKRTEQQ